LKRRDGAGILLLRARHLPRHHCRGLIEARC